ncbi:MAG TPA: hypothetical protein VGI43_18125 [Mucilaginibacter sp.]
MKKIILLILIGLLSANVFAQVNSDSAAYQLERKKINSMLAARSQKFGQYDESLSKRTGIFGFQTKKDIRRSNDILMDIVKTDDDIYKELKILLDYRTFQQTQVQSHSKETEESNIAFMNTINRLRDQVDHLRSEAEKQEDQEEKTQRIRLTVFICMLALILFLSIRKSKRKT